MFPYGKSNWVTQRDPTKLGFYQLIVHQPDKKMNVLPKRDYKDASVPLDWKYKGTFDCYGTTIDLEVMDRAGIPYEVVRGLEFEQKISGGTLFGHLSRLA